MEKSESNESFSKRKQRLEYLRKWKTKHPNYNRDWNRNNPDKVKVYNSKGIEIKKKLWIEVREKLGNKCIICGALQSGTKRKLSCHEIHGKPHQCTLSTVYYILKHMKDFILLCHSCHRAIHQANKNPEAFLKYLSMLKPSESL